MSWEQESGSVNWASLLGEHTYIFVCASFMVIMPLVPYLPHFGFGVARKIPNWFFNHCPKAIACQFSVCYMDGSGTNSGILVGLWQLESIICNFNTRHIVSFYPIWHDCSTCYSTNYFSGDFTFMYSLQYLVYLFLHILQLYFLQELCNKRQILKVLSRWYVNETIDNNFRIWGDWSHDQIGSLPS